MDNLIIWISLGIPLAIRSNLDQLFVEKKCIKLASIFSQIYKEAVSQEVKIKKVEEQNILLAINFLSCFEPVHHLFVNKYVRKDEVQWGK